jgi:methylmalonyl-CoA mutase
MNQEKQEKLFSEFPPVSRREWEKVIESDLKTDDYKAVLKWKTLEDIEPLPFYMREDSISQNTINPKNLSSGWLYTEPIFDVLPDQIHSSIQKAIQRDADAIRITSQLHFNPDSPNGTYYGSSIENQDDFDRIFQDIPTGKLMVLFDSGMASPVYAAMAGNLTRNFRKAAFIFDPLTEAVRIGRTFWSNPKELRMIIDSLAVTGNSMGPAADALFYHKAGASIVCETAIAIAIASEYMAISDPGERVSMARSFFVRLSVGPLYFPEIAKFRALRILWKTLLKAYEVDSDIPLFIHAETTPQNKTLSDPHNNMLRVTSEAMAAVTGGADSIAITPYDASFKDPDEFSKRIAGNVHHILREEAHLDKTTDPAGGSYYIEKLTQLIAGDAWKMFKKIEAEGGFLESVRIGSIQKMVMNSRSRKENAYAARKRVLTGTNNYPNRDEDISTITFRTLHEKSVPFSGSEISTNKLTLIKDLQKQLKSGTKIHDLCKNLYTDQAESIESLEEFNAGEIFDSIRRQTLHLKKRTGKPADIIIIPAGNLKWRNARASFTENLIGCGGFDLQTAPGAENIEDVLSGIETRAPAAAVLCGSDIEYPEMAEAFSRAFSDETILILAGKPVGNEELYKNLGIKEFIHSGLNASEFLQRLQSGIFHEEGSE